VVAGINLPILLNLKGIKDKACIIDYS